MKSWYLKGVKEFDISTDEETSELSEGLVKVKIIRTTVCASDIAMYLGKGIYPMTPCRIATGLISESTDSSLAKGQRVLLSPFSGEDEDTKVKGYELNGYLSDYIICPISDVIPVPETISDESVCFIEDISMALSIIEKLDVSKTEYIGLYGVSALNLIIAQIATYYQAIPVLIDNDSDRLDFALDNDIVYTVNTDEDDLNEKLKEITSGKMLNNLVIDTDNFPEVKDLLNSCAMDAKVGLVGYNPSLANLSGNLSPIVTKGLTVYGCNNGFEELSSAINMLATNIVSVQKLVKEVVDFNDTPKVFEGITQKGLHFKTIIKCY